MYILLHAWKSINMFDPLISRQSLCIPRRVWTPVQFINFSYVPLQFRVLFANVVALGWNAYLAARS